MSLELSQTRKQNQNTQTKQNETKTEQNKNRNNKNKTKGKNGKNRGRKENAAHGLRMFVVLIALVSARATSSALGGTPQGRNLTG